MEQQVDDDYSSVVEILLGMFGEVLCKDAITTIVESCSGNLEESANIIMNITTDGEDCSTEENKTQVLDTNLATTTGQNKFDNHDMQSSNIQVTQKTSNQVMAQNTMMYNQTLHSQPSSSTGALPKRLPKKPVNSKEESEELRQILKFHEEGTRTLILMRGAPGCGKSYMAKKIVDKIYNSHQPHLYSTHIFSSDDYFSLNNNHTYCFEPHKLPDAHTWNQHRSYLAMRQGVSPVIIDNTNIEIWEMECYVREGVKNGYIILILEPNTPWAWKPNQLARRNMHNVPAFKISRMINNYQRVTINEILCMLKLNYNTRPPALRQIPQFTPKAESLLIKPQTVTSNIIQQNMDNIDDKIKQLQVSNNINLQEKVSVRERGDNEESTADSQQHCEESSELVYKDVEKKLEEIAKVEKEWENSEGWDDNTSNIDKINKVSEADQYVKPQRQKRSVKAPSENILSSIGDIQDWTKITMFMPTWNETSPKTKEDSIIPVEKMSSSTCMEIDDTNLSSTKNPLKIISAVPRDINEFYIRDEIEKIPETRMLDKSTSTNNDIMTNTGRCKNEEKHFNEFRKLFKFVNKADLRDIFDKCQGDVNWAVDIVLNDVSYKEVHSLNETLSDSENEEENNKQCECIAAYSVIPDTNSSISDEIKSPPPPIEVTSSPLREKRKIKKDASLSNTSVRLKQQIEKNIVISDDHYSSHFLKVRKKKRGEVDDEKTEKPTELVPDTDTSESNLIELNSPSTSKLISKENSDVESIDDESLGEEPEQTISIDVSKDLMSQLDQHFGWREMIFSENISTKINVPISILNVLNALWIESLLYQIEENEKQLEMMVKQDEEFARELAYKEAELLQVGDEQRKPDFKEIMDMDFAVSLYHKDVAQWRNNEPNDLAAKLSRNKLKALFPEVLSDSLAELLVAHDNNFQRTVESLLVSTGRGEILVTENGISKFIAEKETENREKVIEKKNEGLSETEWPSLPVIEKIDMEVVKKYRLEAEKHLKFRNIAHQKAQDMMKRGMLPAASYYSDIAAYHKTKYEHSNSYAAASLMHLHANNSVDGDTVDLHYLHVREAKESLDLFLDEHIQRLRSEGGGRYQRLFLITGRGLHSNGRPRIKPAVKKRLTERGLSYSQCNPGLLSAKVCADDKLSYQVS